jgi:hypothetical protein
MTRQVDDPRYEYVRCIRCGLRWQRIDFRCALHLLRCPDPEEPAPELVLAAPHLPVRR